MVGERRGIAADGEHSSVSGDHHRPDVITAVESRHFVDEGGMHGAVPCVRSMRPVQRDDCHAVVYLAQHRSAIVGGHVNPRELATRRRTILAGTR